MLMLPGGLSLRPVAFSPRPPGGHGRSSSARSRPHERAVVGEAAQHPPYSLARYLIGLSEQESGDPGRERLLAAAWESW